MPRLWVRATGIVVGLVAITPAAGFVSPIGALALGAIAAFPSYFAIVLRSRTRLDDSLDVFAGHGIGGFTGRSSLACSRSRCGGPTECLVATQAAGHSGRGRVPSMAYAGVMTFVIPKLLALVAPLRVATRRSRAWA